MKTILSAFVTLAILAGVAPASAQKSQPAGSIDGTVGLAQALRTGGHVILVRHGATFSNRDRITASDTFTAV